MENYMELNKIWNEDNLITMSEHIDEKSIDVILTSPPYNNSRDNDDRTNLSINHCKSSNVGQYKDADGNGAYSTHRPSSNKGLARV